MSEIPLGLVAGVIGITMIIIDIWLVYVIYVYTDKAETLLPNSIFVEANRSAYSQAGLIGKVMRNGFLTAVLMMPVVCSKRGICDLSEARKFPKGLKRLLFISWGAGFLVFATLVLFGMYIKFSEAG